MSEPKVLPFPSPRLPLEARTDDELMVLARAGAREAFAVLASRYMAGLVGFCAKASPKGLGTRHSLLGMCELHSGHRFALKVTTTILTPCCARHARSPRPAEAFRSSTATRRVAGSYRRWRRQRSEWTRCLHALREQRRIVCSHESVLAMRGTVREVPNKRADSSSSAPEVHASQRITGGR